MLTIWIAISNGFQSNSTTNSKHNNDFYGKLLFPVKKKKKFLGVSLNVSWLVSYHEREVEGFKQRKITLHFKK